MVVVMRFLAQLIDIVLYFVILVASYILLLPIVQRFVPSNTYAPISVFIITLLLYFLLQYPFYKNKQTIGKGFFGLHIKFNRDAHENPFISVFIREVFIKLMSLYMLCLPVFFGKEGLHEKATSTEIICLK